MTEPNANGLIRVAVIAASTARAEAVAARVRANDVRVAFAGIADEIARSGGIDVIVAADLASLRNAARVPQIGGPRIPVVLVTDPDGRVGRGTMPRAEAELGDDAPPAQIRAAVLAVAAGLVVSRPEEPDRAVRARPADLDDEPNVESLTPRELQVLDALALGLSNRAIASRLGLSEHTVKFHVASILGKLEARTRTQAVRRGLARGLLAI